MEEKNITQQESLAIIQQMIDKTKQKLNDNSKFFFLWGFAVFICAITQYVMLKMLLLNTQKVWIAMPIIAIIHIILAIKRT
jgi:cobalamin biosynthesis protein CobD/CbiB